MPGRDLLAGSGGGTSRRGRDFLGGTPTVKKPSSGGGLFGGIGHVFSQAGADIYHAAVDSPKGLYELGKGVVQTVEQHPLAAAYAPSLWTAIVRDKSNPLHKTAVAMAQQTVQDVRHPLRHPGYTALDLAAVASVGAGAGARLGAAGRALKTGESIGAAVREVSAPKTLTMRAHGATAVRPASRATLTRVVQTQINDLRNRFPDARLPIKTQTQRVGKRLAETRSIDYKLRTAPAQALRYKGRKIKPFSPEGMAMRAVAEGTPPDVMITKFRQLLTTAKTPLERKQLNRQIRLATQARKFVTPDLKFTDAKLAQLYSEVEKIGTAKDVSMVESGLAPASVLEAAKHKPGRAYRGQDLLGGEFTGGRTHVGYQFKNKPYSVNRAPAAGNAYTINTGRALPSRLTHPFTGGAIEKGRIRHDVPRLVAENALESERHAALLRSGAELYAMAQDTPVGLKHPVAIKAPDQLGKTLPIPAQDFQDAYRAGRQLNEKQTSLLGMTYDSIRQQVFPNVTPEQWPGISAADLPEFQGIKWIESDLLGGLNQPPPLASLLATKGGRKTFAFIDTINNASKGAILYLKPAYITPNVVGNAFLTLTQQGWAAPKNIAAAARLMKRLGPEDTMLVDSLMGEGIATSLSSEGGALSKAMQVAAGAYGKVVDVPFRRASFIYEARRELGRGTKWQEIKSLLHDPAKRPQLQMAAQRANRALIDYGDLTPFERAIVRRVLFFYPWLKGSTRYAKDYLTDHPQQAALLSESGQYGATQTQQELGALPSWAQGIFQVGGSGNLPLTVNPTAAGILSQPAQLGAVAARLGGANLPGSGYDLQQLLTPAFGAAVQALAGQNQFGGQSTAPPVSLFSKNLYGGIPAMTLYQRLTKDQSQKTYPMTQLQAILQYLVGGVVPRTTNRTKLNQSAARERAGR
jgi:hypothetical protein